MKIFLSIILMVSFSFAGSVTQIYNSLGQKVYQIKPSCKKQARDTCGPIKMDYSKYFSFTYRGNAFIYRDTAICDSGFIVRLYGSNSTARKLIRIISADSVVRPINSNDTLRSRVLTSAIGLSIPVLPYYWVVFERWDTNADTLDCKRANGVIDTVFTVNTFGEK